MSEQSKPPLSIEMYRRQRLSEALSSTDADAMCGPLYEVVRKGRPVMSVQLFQRYISDASRHHNVPDNLLFVAYDDQNVLGYREMFLHNSRDQIAVQGNVLVFRRERGVASVLEDATADHLQGISTHWSKKVIHRIHDVNLSDLTMKEQQYSIVPNEMTRHALELQREERQRWLHLWGEGGVYGVHNGVRRFYPVPGGMTIPLSHMSVVQLQTGDRYTKHIIPYEPSEYDELQEYRRNNIQLLLKSENGQ